MKEQILAYIIKEFGSSIPVQQRIKHYSYCKFPEMECTCQDLNEISYDTQLINGGYIDSFSMAGVVVFLEQTFNVKFPDFEITPTNFNSVDRMVSLVEKYSK